MFKPNIIYILADDMGYGDLSCLNEESRIQTPHLDSLAAGGMIFSDAHASSAVCTPSRYSILTGRYNWRSCLKQGVTMGYDVPLIEQERMTVASFLKKHGYKTACFGKWHLGWTWPKKSRAREDVDYARPIRNGPTTLGFDYFFGISASLDMPPYVYVENDMPTAMPDRFAPAGEGKGFWREGPIAPDFKHEDVLPELTRRAVSWIKTAAHEKLPFFCYFPLTAPHTPILPQARFRGKSGTNAYGDFCLEVDDVVGQIIAAVEQQGLAENTIIIFAADNGCSPQADFQELAAFGHNPSYVFRGHKADIFEGGHRIPLLARWPARIRPGSRSDATVCLADFMATCADILGDTLPDNAGEDSVSNLPVWEGRLPHGGLREATVHHSIDGSFSIRKGKWKLEMCPGSGGWSYPRPGEDCKNLPPIQLYNLSDDIGERDNLYDKHPEIVEELKALLTQYVRDGRSTPGQRQGNDGRIEWAQLWWMLTQKA